MVRDGMWRGMAVLTVCAGMALAAPTGAIALTTHSATDTSANSAGQLVATAKCGANERVVSGGFKSQNVSAAVVSHAVQGNSWTVRLVPGVIAKLTTYAYCGPKSGTRISTHEKTVMARHASHNTSATTGCSSGETLISGGYAFLSTPSGQGNSPTFKDYAASVGKWTVMSAIENIPAQLEAFAYCQRGADVKVRSRSSGMINHGGNGSATASCHKGETLLAGGYTTTPKPDWNNAAGPDLFYSASYRSGVRSWTASAHNYGKPGEIKAFAYCMP